jgi:hypothetical protein
MLTMELTTFIVLKVRLQMSKHTVRMSDKFIFCNSSNIETHIGVHGGSEETPNAVEHLVGLCFRQGTKYNPKYNTAYMSKETALALANALIYEANRDFSTGKAELEGLKNRPVL